MNNEICLGIDFGTTNSAVGGFINGIVEIIPNQINGRTTPSVVSFCDNKISIGELTQNKPKLLDEPEKVISSIKRIIGKKSTEYDYNKLVKDLPYHNKISINEKNRPLIIVDFNGEKRQYLPEDIAAMFFKHLKDNAEKYLKKPVKKAVITIPAYFTELQREATKMAAEAAGFEILKIINEPTAAALAFGLGEKDDLERIDELEETFSFLGKNKNKDKKRFCDNLKDNEVKKVVVFDLGGGTLDVTCLKIAKEGDFIDFEVLGHSGNTTIGGDDFDNSLVNYCIEKFNKENKTYINLSNKEGRIAQKRLKTQCELAKRFLSNEDETTIAINSLYNGKDFNISINRATFEDQCKKLFDKIIEPIEEALKVSETKKKDIEEVLLVGGSTRMPKIQEIIKKFFGNKVIIQKSLNPDEIVAYGATLQAAKCMDCEAVDGLIINDICSHSIGISIKDTKEFSRIINNGEKIPFESEQEYTTLYDYQRSALIQIFEGEDPYCLNNRFLGSFSIENITLAKAGIPKIKVKIEIDQDGIVKVSAIETISNSSNYLIIKNDKGIMSEEERKRMNQKLNNKEFFEKITFNNKEAYLIQSIKNLMKDFKKTLDIKTLDEIKEKQEEIINICMDEINKNNIEKLYKNIKYIFYLYKYIFVQYHKNNEYKSRQYLQKIEKYMNLFKVSGANYIKSLLMIFKDDTCIERISKIVHICIKIFQDILNDPNYKNLTMHYAKEILGLLQKFKSSIYSSTLKSKFEQIENECTLKSIPIPISIEENIKENSEDDYLIKLYNTFTIEQALFALDQNTYTIQNLGAITDNSKEQAFRALLLTRVITLELLFLKKPEFQKLYKMTIEAIKLVNSLGLEPRKNKWIFTLYNNEKKIKKKLNEDEEKNKSKLESWTENVKGDNDEQNIRYLEFIQTNCYSEKFEKSLKGKTVKYLYKSKNKKDKETLRRSMSFAIEKIPGKEKPETKGIIGKFKLFLNKIFKFLK